MPTGTYARRGGGGGWMVGYRRYRMSGQEEGGYCT